MERKLTEEDFETFEEYIEAFVTDIREQNIQAKIEYDEGYNNFI